MLRKLMDRFREPSSYAGLGLIAYGLGDLFKFKEADQIAEVANQTADAMTVDTASGIGVLLFGLLSLFIKEKSK